MASFGSNVLQKGYLILLVLAFSTLIPAVPAGVPINICSSFNAAQTPLNVSIWQSNGLCTTFCINKNYAFAITQANSCWCTNYYPDQASVVDIKECNSPCPGWSPDDCGAGTKLFGYIVLNEVAPSGTSTGPPTSTPTQSTASKSSSTTSSSKATSTSASTSISSSTSETSTTSSSSSYSSSTSSSSSSSTTSTTTSSSSSSSSSTGQSSSGGGLPTQTADPNGDETGITVKKKSGLGTGGIVGIAVGVVGGVLVIAAALLFWFLRRRRQNRDEYQDDPSVRGSSSGMVGSGPPEMSVNGGSPASPVSAANRNSTIQIDPRMDPFKQGLYIRGSHESLNTIRDDHDYSRRIQKPVLRATNPDPEDG